MQTLREGWYRAKRRIAYLGALVILKIIDAMLRTMGYKRTSQWLLRLSPVPNPQRDNYARARLIAIAVDTASTQRMVDVTCLRRSLALWWILRWMRLPSVVRLGFRNKDGHAWVEHHNRVINDLPDVSARYPVMNVDTLTPESMAKLI